VRGSNRFRGATYGPARSAQSGTRATAPAHRRLSAGLPAGDESHLSRPESLQRHRAVARPTMRRFARGLTPFDLTQGVLSFPKDSAEHTSLRGHHCPHAGLSMSCRSAVARQRCPASRSGDSRLPITLRSESNCRANVSLFSVVVTAACGQRACVVPNAQFTLLDSQVLERIWALGIEH
jgi:hypothetical protein